MLKLFMNKASVVVYCLHMMSGEMEGQRRGLEDGRGKLGHGELRGEEIGHGVCSKELCRLPRLGQEGLVGEDGNLWGEEMLFVQC